MRLLWNSGSTRPEKSYCITFCFALRSTGLAPARALQAWLHLMRHFPLVFLCQSAWDARGFIPLWIVWVRGLAYSAIWFWVLVILGYIHMLSFPRFDKKRHDQLVLVREFAYPIEFTGLFLMRFVLSTQWRFDSPLCALEYTKSVNPSRRQGCPIL
jgi:hypothetical protein